MRPRYNASLQGGPCYSELTATGRIRPPTHYFATLFERELF
jgi:hypothetical protein